MRGWDTSARNDTDNPYYNVETITKEEAHNLLVRVVEDHVVDIKKLALERGIVLSQQELDAYRRWYDSADMYVNGDYRRNHPKLP